MHGSSLLDILWWDADWPLGKDIVSQSSWIIFEISG